MKKYFILFAIGLAAITFSSCHSSKAGMDSVYMGGRESAASYSGGRSIVKSAMKYMGRPYKYGSTGPNGFDCSGLVFTAYKENGISIARSSSEQYRQGKKIKKIKKLKEGDLVFFCTGKSRRTVNHVGIVSDVDKKNNDFLFIHAASKGVTTSNYASSYYRKRYAGARRIIE
jgi:cell wall-associated NlpC family hydrolase